MNTNFNNTIFLHGISLQNWHACWNFSINGRICSPDIYFSNNPSFKDIHKSVYETSLEELQSRGTPFPTPRFISFFKDIILEHNIQTGKLLLDIKPEHINKINLINRIEFEFERIRREIANNSPTRLSCLWIAEDNDIGRKHIYNMLGNVFITRVKIPIFKRVQKVDTEWFEKYYEENDKKYIYNKSKKSENC